MGLNAYTTRWALAAGLATAVATGSLRARAANTLLSGFDGNVSSSIGTDWSFNDVDSSTPGVQEAPHAFTTEGVVQGTQALSINANPDWTMPMTLKPTAATRPNLINLFANND